MRFVPLLLLIFACTHAQGFDEEGQPVVECWSWGQSECSSCKTIRVEPVWDEKGNEAALENTDCVEAKSEGLSENGMRAIIETIARIPEYIIKAFIPIF